MIKRLTILKGRFAVPPSACSRLGPRARARAAASIIVLGCAACGNPQLNLELEIHQPYRDEVGSVTLQILEPTQAVPFSCDDLALGSVDPDAIALSRVGEVSTDSLTTDLSDIDRIARKVFWADGLAEGDRRIVTGCMEVGEIKSDTTVRIVAEPVAHVTVPEGVSLSAVLGQPLAKAVTIEVKDALGMPLADVAASYSIEGAEGAGSNGQTTSDPQGVVTISPTLPNRPGPFVLDIRVRWAEDAPVFLSGVIAPVVESLTLPGPAIAYKTGSIGTDRERGFAALIADPPGVVKVATVFQNAMTGVREMHVSDPLGSLDTPQLGIIEYSGRGPDKIIAVSSTNWYEIAADGALAERPVYTTPPGGTFPLGIFTGGPCAGADQPGVLIAFEGGIVGVYSKDGMLADNFVLPNALELSASGCVSNQNDALERTLVFGTTGGIGVIPAVAMDNDFLAASWFALPTAIAFSPPLGDGRRQMFGTQLSVNDIVVSRVSLKRTADTLDVVIEGNDAVPNVPRATQAGDIDGDQRVDAVSLFQRSDMTARLAVWAVLGREHRGRRISADVDLGSAGLRNPALMLVDIDRDGFDDVLLGELANAGASSKVEIYSMGAN